MQALNLRNWPCRAIAFTPLAASSVSRSSLPLGKGPEIAPRDNLIDAELLSSATFQEQERMDTRGFREVLL